MAEMLPVALVLEDEPLISMDVEHTLRSAGFAVVTVMSRTDAKDWLERNKPDVAIVDILLRDGECSDTVIRLVGSSIPFVVYSGEQQARYAGTAFARGTWLGKPAEPLELARAVRAAAYGYRVNHSEEVASRSLCSNHPCAVNRLAANLATFPMAAAEMTIRLQRLLAGVAP